MTSSLAVPSAAREGSQQPRVASFPQFAYSSGSDAVELAASVGLVLDPWQQFVLDKALAERGDGKWASFEVGVVVARQNGKGSILEARELAGLFLFGEQLIMHSAHEFKTAAEAFRRVLSLIEMDPALMSRVKKVYRSHGDEGIELKSGARLRFVARTGGSGRGFSGDVVILDEAFNLPEAAMSALMPTMSARPNPQLWYTSSAVDKEIHPNGMVLARLRGRGHSGAEGLAYFEWAADPNTDPMDVGAWAEANPGLGIRISAEHVGREQRSMAPKTFAVERLSIGDWPEPDDGNAGLIAAPMWATLLDPASQLVGVPSFAVDVKRDRTAAAIVVAGVRADGLSHVELVDYQPGTSWVVPRLKDLASRWNATVLLDPGGPAGALLTQLQAEQVRFDGVTGRELAQACGAFFAAVGDGRLRHRGDPDLAASVVGGRTRQLGDAWVWSRTASVGDAAPLIAASLALRGCVTTGSVYNDRGLLVL